MAFDEYMNAGLDALAETLGQSITYYPAAGGSRSITGVFTLKRRRNESAPSRRLDVSDGCLVVSKGSDGVTTATPQQDTFSIGGQTWTLVSVESDSDAHFTLNIERAITLATRKHGSIMERLS